ncbi:hypothetical protein NMY22_g1671 [Coprinellus aureogranulatus]|nr:hypothetical protein NMY22_g1671 [Coprinellus aureogranulatus]
MTVSTAALRKLRELSAPSFQSILDYSACRFHRIILTYTQTAGRAPGDRVQIFLEDFQDELVRNVVYHRIQPLDNDRKASATYLFGLGRLFHSSNVKPPLILQKLANIQSLGQLWSITAMSELLASEEEDMSTTIDTYECDWWSIHAQNPGPLKAGPPVTPELLFECWRKQKDLLAPAPRIREPTIDFLDLLPLSRDELNLAFRTAEQLMQETAMETITTLEYLRQVDESIANLDTLLDNISALATEDGKVR